jgi:ATP synthase protein I
MDDKKRNILRTLGYVSTLGMAMAISVGLGVFIGRYLDMRFETGPWFFFIFLGFGIVAAFKNLHIMYKKSKDL